MNIKFETRSGIKIEGIVRNPNTTPSMTVEITKARKPFMGRTMVFQISDMIGAAFSLDASYDDMAQVDF